MKTMRTRGITAILSMCALASCDSPTRPAYDAELDRARAATERYRQLANALADGYENINVIMPQMGHHFLRSSLVDATFDPERPEILVYQPEGNGFRLVAVEYAIPLSTSASAPQGFAGDADVWDRNEGFGLWLLHAWVWEENPAGVFEPFNPVVP